MDLCHCPSPKVEADFKGNKFCTRCGMWYSEKEWKRDPRVKAVHEHVARLSLNIVREVRPAVADPYAPCPCGSGKKAKFCQSC